MKLLLKHLVVAGLIMTMTAGLANVSSAADELGQFCWSLTPYVDTVRLSVSVVNGQVPMFLIMADWRAGSAPERLGCPLNLAGRKSASSCSH